MKKINFDFKNKIDTLKEYIKPQNKRYTLKGRNTKLQNKYVFPIIALILVSLGIGFAYVESKLKINGAVEISNSLWDVHFQNLVISDGSMKAVTPATIDQHDPTKITFSIKFSESYSDFYGFTVDVVNNGIVDAKISYAKLDVGNLEGFLDYALTYSDGEEIKENDLLLSKNKDRIRVLLRLKDDADIERMMTVGTQNITLDVQYVQDVEGGTKRPLTGTGPNIIQSLGLTRKAKNSGEINYNNAPSASDTTGSGLYYLANSKNDEYPIYFYRGAVDNNNIIFAGLCWKIVRTTEMGGTKLVYNGHPVNNTCTATGVDTQLNAAGSQFNTSKSVPADVGVMFGKKYSYYQGDNWNSSSTVNFTNDLTVFSYNSDTNIYSQTCNNKCSAIKADAFSSTVPVSSQGVVLHYTLSASLDKDKLMYTIYSVSTRVYGLALTDGDIDIEDAKVKMFTNSNNSNMINILNDFYKANIEDKGLTAYLENSVWCNDRSFIDGDLLSDKAIPVSKGLSHFGAYDRVNDTVSPAIKDSSTCPNENDRFTTTDARYGTSSLKYSIGLLTADEAMLAGQGAFGYAATNADGYLYNGQNFWTMTPSSYLGTTIGDAKLYYVTTEGKLAEGSANASYGVRPSIVIKAGVTVSEGGEGTASNPYIIETY